MSLEPNTFAFEISDILAAAGEDYTTTATDLGIYGTSYEITKLGTDRKLHLTPLEDGLIDMILFDETGTTIANATLFNKATTGITPKELATIVKICLKG